MKKLSIFLIALVLLLSLTACGRSNESQTDSNNQNNSENNTDNQDTRTRPNHVVPDVIPDTIPDMEQNVPDPDIKGNDSHNKQEQSGVMGGESIPNSSDSNR